MLARARAACAAARPLPSSAATRSGYRLRPAARSSCSRISSLPWCRPQNLFVEAARVLEAGGLLLFATLGPDSLQEVRRAWAAVDDRFTCMRRSTCTTSATSRSRQG